MDLSFHPLDPVAPAFDRHDGRQGEYRPRGGARPREARPAEADDAAAADAALPLPWDQRALFDRIAHELEILAAAQLRAQVGARLDVLLAEFLAAQPAGRGPSVPVGEHVGIGLCEAAAQAAGQLGRVLDDAVAAGLAEPAGFRALGHLIALRDPAATAWRIDAALPARRAAREIARYRAASERAFADAARALDAARRLASGPAGATAAAPDPRAAGGFVAAPPHGLGAGSGASADALTGALRTPGGGHHVDPAAALRVLGGE